MKTRLGIIGTVMIMCNTVMSCGIIELDRVEKDDANGVWNGPAMDIPESSRSITYVSAFDYPDGYDWRSDPQRGEVRCSLVVFREGVPMLKVPVGNVYNVSADPDMHRIIDGHLYTDFSANSQTIIKKDGKPLLSYQKEEMICEFRILDADVHTLGHSRQGEGFSYRVNGEVVLERDTGYTFERICVEENSISIAFSEPITSADGTIERYYVMRDGKVSQVALRDDIKKVWDVASYNGEVYYLATLTGIATPVMVAPQGITALPMPTSLSLVSCKMRVLSKGVFAEGVLTDGKQVQSIFWDTKAKYNLFPKGLTFSAMCQGDDVVHYTMNPASMAGAGLICRGGENLEMPAGYACMSRSAIDFASGMLSVGLSSLTGAEPTLWIDGELKSFDVNGYISCVASQKL